MSQQRPKIPGEQSAAFSREVVRITADHTGRGPTRVRTTIADDVVCVVLQDVLTKGERALLDNGEHALVTELRRAYHRAMQPALTQAAKAITGREVLAVLSDHSPGADMSTINFVLTPLLATRAAASALSYEQPPAQRTTDPGNKVLRHVVVANSTVRDQTLVDQSRAATDRKQAAQDRVAAAVAKREARIDLQRAQSPNATERTPKRTSCGTARTTMTSETGPVDLSLGGER